MWIFLFTIISYNLYNDWLHFQKQKIHCCLYSLSLLLKPNSHITSAKYVTSCQLSSDRNNAWDRFNDNVAVRPLQIDYLVDGLTKEIRESGRSMICISTYLHNIVGFLLFNKVEDNNLCKLHKHCSVRDLKP